MMIASAACFTINVLLIRALAVVQPVNIWLTSCTRFIIGLLIVYAFYRREFQPTHLFRNRQLAARGLIGGLTVFGFYLTVVKLGAGRATFINNTYVIFGALGAVWWLGERFRGVLVFGSLAALGGLALLTNAFAADTPATIYDLLGVSVALSAAYVVITIRQLHATEHTATIFAAQCAYGLLIGAVPALMMAEPTQPLGWLIMVLSGICAGVGQIAMTHAFRDLPVAEGSLLQMLVPLGIALGGIALFGERFAPHELVGAALILIGTAVTAWRR